MSKRAFKLIMHIIENGATFEMDSEEMTVTMGTGICKGPNHTHFKYDKSCLIETLLNACHWVDLQNAYKS